MVYFIRVKNEGPIKIGHTDRPVEMRLREIQAGCPFPVELIATMEGDLRRERRLHSAFEDSRLYGEWYEPTKALTDTIEEIKKLAS